MMHFDQRLRNMAQRLGALEREEELYPRHDEQVRASRKARTSHDTADLAAYLEHTTTTVDELFNELQRLDQTLADTVRSTEARLAQIEQDRGYEQGGGVGEISLKVRNLIHTELARKVDESVLEELMRHIVTRDELRKTLEKMSTKFMGEAQSGMGEEVLAERMKHWAIETYRDFLVKAPDGQRISAREIVEQARKELVEPLEVKLNKLAKAVAMPQPQVVDVPQVVFKDVPQVVEAPATSITALSHLDDPVAKRLADQLARDFDEKLFLLSSEFDEWRAKHGKHHSPANGALLPAHASRQAQWRWTSGTLKFGANIPWNEQPHNTDPSNFHWSPNTATIKVRDSGIYELAFGIFSRARPTLHLVVNGESVMSAIHSPSYVVRHAGVSGLMAREVSTLGGGGGDKVAGDGDDEDLPIVKQASVTGCTLVDFLLLPPNATISMNFFGNAQAVGFMSLRRL